MNSRQVLKSLFEQGGFEEELFLRADDCSTTSRFKATYFVELTIWKLLKLVGLPYPESNLIAVFRKR